MLNISLLTESSFVDKLLNKITIQGLLYFSLVYTLTFWIKGKRHEQSYFIFSTRSQVFQGI